MTRRLPRFNLAVLGRYGQYLLSVFLVGVTGLISIPVVIKVAGSGAWAEVAVGQAAGLLVATAVAYGWPVTGPAVVASGRACDRWIVWRASIRSRLAILPLGSTVLLIWWYLSVRGSASAPSVLLAALSASIGGLSAVWFFVGEGQPGRVALLDVLPRVLGTICGIALIVETGELIAFVAAQLVGQLCSIAFSWADIGRRYGGNFSPSDAKPTQVRSGFVAAVFSSAYQNAPMILIGHFGGGALAAFVMGDRLLKLGAMVLAPVAQVAQGWVPQREHLSELWSRIRRAFFAVGAIALAAVGLFAALAPLAGQLLSGGQVEVPLSIALPLGVVLGAIQVSYLIGRSCLVPLGAARSMANVSVAAAVIGVPAIALAGYAYGAIGVAVGLSAVEVAVVVALGWKLQSLRRDGAGHLPPLTADGVDHEGI